MHGKLPDTQHLIRGTFFEQGLEKEKTEQKPTKNSQKGQPYLLFFSGHGLSLPCFIKNQKNNFFRESLTRKRCIKKVTLKHYLFYYLNINVIILPLRLERFYDFLYSQKEWFSKCGFYNKSFGFDIFLKFIGG